MKIKNLLFLIFIVMMTAGCASRQAKSSYMNKSAIWQDTKSHEAIKELNKQLPDK